MTRKALLHFKKWMNILYTINELDALINQVIHLIFESNLTTI